MQVLIQIGPLVCLIEILWGPRRCVRQGRYISKRSLSQLRRLLVVVRLLTTITFDQNFGKSSLENDFQNEYATASAGFGTYGVRVWADQAVHQPASRILVDGRLCRGSGFHDCTKHGRWMRRRLKDNIVQLFLPHVVVVLQQPHRCKG